MMKDYFGRLMTAIFTLFAVFCGIVVYCIFKYTAVRSEYFDTIPVPYAGARCSFLRWSMDACIDYGSLAGMIAAALLIMIFVVGSIDEWDFNLKWNLRTHKMVIDEETHSAKVISKCTGIDPRNRKRTIHRVEVIIGSDNYNYDDLETYLDTEPGDEMHAKCKVYRCGETVVKTVLTDLTHG